MRLWTHPNSTPDGIMGLGLKKLCAFCGRVRWADRVRGARVAGMVSGAGQGRLGLLCTS